MDSSLKYSNSIFFYDLDYLCFLHSFFFSTFLSFGANFSLSIIVSLFLGSYFFIETSLSYTIAKHFALHPQNTFQAKKITFAWKIRKILKTMIFVAKYILNMKIVLSKIFFRYFNSWIIKYINYHLNPI